LFAERMLFETIAVAPDVDDPGVMQEPVEDGRSDDGIAKELLPVAEAFVRGDDRRALLVAVRDELEEQIGLAALDGQVAGLVDDDQAALR